MNFLSPSIIRIARKDVDLAIKGLMFLNRTRISKNSRTNRKLLIAHHLCGYSRYVHISSWRYRISITRVQSDVIQELEKARIKLSKLFKKGELTNDEKYKINRYQQNILDREINLRDNYCKGQPSSFEFNAKDPHRKSYHKKGRIGSKRLA